MQANTDQALRLTSFSHGGGCGCKIAPGVLADILKQSQGFPVPPQLLVGIETADDAAVYLLNDEQALIATTDFFMPIVDDPTDFGRIAATNAISDVYAMGGTPIMALALVGMPIDKLPIDTIGKILAGGEAICAEAGIPIAGGHTIDSVEPIYGLVVMGLVHPSHIKRNANAKNGDQLILGKPLGVGVLSAALLGHAREMARGANVQVNIQLSSVPFLSQVLALAEQGFITGASARNWNGYHQDITLDSSISDVQKALLCDPQTSGGLLVACASDEVDAVMACFHAHGFAEAAVIGNIQDGTTGVQVNK